MDVVLRLARVIQPARMEGKKRSIEEVNSLECREFTEFLGHLYERTPIVVAAVWCQRPFKDISELHRSCCLVVDSLGSAGQIGLLRCHPDLAGRLAVKGQLSEASAKEQSSAGLLSLSEEEFRRMGEQNEQYMQKFGFPFVICVRENKKEAIVEGFKARLVNSKDVEVAIAINEVKKIAWHRLQDVVTNQHLPRL